MSIINLLELEPTEISRDLSNKYILLYSRPKVGKTSFAASIPNNLIFCFEKGVNFLSGIYAVDVPRWTDFKALLRQLRKPEMKEKYTTVTLDTISIAWSLCEQFICDQNQVKTIASIPWGRGYQEVVAEFSGALREISLLGYGMVLITHAKIKSVKVDDENTVEMVSPNIPERVQDIVNALVDIIGYIELSFDSEGNAVRTLITRETPHIVAGGRLKYIAPKIPFGYQELVNAINNAIDMQEKLDGDTITDTEKVQPVIKKRPFHETQEEAKQLWTGYVGDDVHKAEDIMLKVEQIFGKRIKLSEISEKQQDLFELLIDEMKSL